MIKIQDEGCRKMILIFRDKRERKESCEVQKIYGGGADNRCIGAGIFRVWK